MNASLAQFETEQYLNLATYRKDGREVQTPVWFVEQGGILFVRTIQGSGKVKRIRHNPEVRVVPCEVYGEPKGEWLRGRARLATAAESEEVNRLMEQKYGRLKREMESKTLSQGLEYVVLAIEL